MGNKQTKVQVLKMKLRNGTEYHFPSEQGTSSRMERMDAPMIEEAGTYRFI